MTRWRHAPPPLLSSAAHVAAPSSGARHAVEVPADDVTDGADLYPPAGGVPQPAARELMRVAPASARLEATRTRSAASSWSARKDYSHARGLRVADVFEPSRLRW